MNTTLKLLFLFILTSSCSSTYYKGSYRIKIEDTYRTDKEIAVRNINQIAESFNLKPDTIKTDEDSISFYGPPYHYIQFIFDRNENADSLEFILYYYRILASQKTTNRIYFGIKNRLDSVYGERIKYTVINKNHKP